MNGGPPCAGDLCAHHGDQPADQVDADAEETAHDAERHGEGHHRLVMVPDEADEEPNADQADADDERRLRRQLQDAVVPVDREQEAEEDEEDEQADARDVRRPAGGDAVLPDWREAGGTVYVAEPRPPLVQLPDLVAGWILEVERRHAAPPRRRARVSLSDPCDVGRRSVSSGTRTCFPVRLRLPASAIEPHFLQTTICVATAEQS